MTTTNGKPADLQAIHEQRKAVRARLRLAQDKQLLEALWLFDDFGGSDTWDRFRPRTNDAGDASTWLPINVPSDRRHGSNWPLWRQQSELDMLRQEARVRCQTNSFARGLIKNLVNTVIGKGFAYKADYLGDDGKPATELAPDQEQHVRLTQAVIDDFLKLNHWNGMINHDGHNALAGTREREVMRTVLIDGECFLRFHFQSDGRSLVRFIDSSNVRDGSTGYTPQEGWSYGIQHQMEPFEDVESLRAYAVFWPDVSAPGGSEDNRGTWEYVDASEVLHLKGADTPSNVKRGLSAFLYDTGRALDRAAKLQSYASTSAAIRAATAEHWQYDQSTQTQISSMQQALAERQFQNPVTGKTEFVERIRPGTIRRGPIGATLVPPATDNTQIYMAGVQGDLQEACAGVQVPSFTVGDVSSGNYSNYESASFPPVLNAQTEQEYYKCAFAKVVWKALQWAVECGKLPGDTGTRILVQVEAPAVLHRNELEKAQEDQIGVQNGWKSPQTCAAERGLDYKAEAANIQEYRDSQLAMSPLPMPGEEDSMGTKPKLPDETRGRG